MGRPYSPSAEKSVLGSILLRGEVLEDVAAIVRSESDFYDGGHQRIFAAMLALRGRRMPVDMLSVADVMRSANSMGWLEARGGEGYLAALAQDGIVDAKGIDGHARIVRDKALKRRLMDAAQRALEMAERDEEPFEELFAKAHGDVLTLADDSLSYSASTLKDTLNLCVQQLQERHRRKQAVTGIPTGLDEFDDMTGGWQPGTLNILGARPAMGKTAAALGWGVAAAERGFPVLIHSMEMLKERLGDRILSQTSGVDGMKMRSGFLESQDWIRLTRTVPRIAALPILINDSPRQDLALIGTQARRWRQDPQYFTGERTQGLLVVDYLQLLRASSSAKRQQSREREVAEFSQGLQALAKELRVAVLALASLNRSCENRPDKRPLPADLRDSGNIESDADTITMLYRDEVYNPETTDKGVAEFILGKHRDGPTGTVKTAWLAGSARFENLSRRSDPWSPTN